MSLEGFKVVTSKEMAAQEKASIRAGASGLKYMLKAAEGLASEVEAFVKRKALNKNLLLLVGKGNNGGDSLAMATLLIKKKGFSATAYLCFEKGMCSPLLEKMLAGFEKQGGKALYITSSKQIEWESDSVIIDALFGTGFSGSPPESICDIIDAANQSGHPILSIDIPSGIDGSTGAKGASAIHATCTYFLGLPKTGFFLLDGFENVGHLQHVDFGLDAQFTSQMEPAAYLVDIKQLKEQLPRLKRCQHKYLAGHVAIIAGSPSMEGAAFLVSKACYRTGAGLVHLFSSKHVDPLFFEALPEVIKGAIDKELATKIKALKALKACVIGPGLDTSCSKTKKALEEVLESEALCSFVIDASGLMLLKKSIEAPGKKNIIITPHRGEMARLLGVDKLSDKGLFETMQGYSEKTGTVIVLKGAPTFIFAPGVKPLIITAGSPAMSTAGSGDVLSGMIGALAAKGLDLRIAAALGAYIHAVSGERACKKLSDYSLLASDLIEQIPGVIAQMEQ